MYGGNPLSNHDKLCRIGFRGGEERVGELKIFHELFGCHVYLFKALGRVPLGLTILHSSEF